MDLAGTVYHVLNETLMTNLGDNTTWQVGACGGETEHMEDM